jgi:hypothetical protein
MAELKYVEQGVAYLAKPVACLAGVSARNCMCQNILSKISLLCIQNIQISRLYSFEEDWRQQRWREGGWRGGGWRGGAQNGDKQKKFAGRGDQKGRVKCLASVADPERFIPDPNPTIDSFQSRNLRHSGI